MKKSLYLFLLAGLAFTFFSCNQGPKTEEVTEEETTVVEEAPEVVKAPAVQTTPAVQETPAVENEKPNKDGEGLIKQVNEGVSLKEIQKEAAKNNGKDKGGEKDKGDKKSNNDPQESSATL